MSNFWEIKKKDYYWTAMELKKYLPELKGSYVDDIENHLRGSGLGIVKEESVPRPIWARLSLPFALVFLLLLFVTMPIKFMITGTWGYKWQWLSNWFRSLGW